MRDPSEINALGVPWAFISLDPEGEVSIRLRTIHCIIHETFPLKGSLAITE